MQRCTLKMFLLVVALTVLLVLAPSTVHSTTAPPALVGSCPWTDSCGPHGTCLNSTYNNLCNCDRGFSTGNWDLNWSAIFSPGSASATAATIADNRSYSCVECLPNYFGIYCQFACPGTLSISSGSSSSVASCSGHGVCSSGVSGTGECLCSGNWSGATCSTCKTNLFGANCSFQCPACYASGTVRCDDGPTGSGSCICAAGYSGALCDRCAVAAGYFWQASTKRCIACPANPVTDAICSGPSRGRCAVLPPLSIGGELADGVCYCNDGYAGSSCQDAMSCPSCRCGGVPCIQCPPCLNAAAGSFCNNRTGRCVCPPGYFGAQCEQTCPTSSSTAACSGHGVCHESNRSCTCNSPNMTFPANYFGVNNRRNINASWSVFDGVWNGSACDRCGAEYIGGEPTGCTRRCPVNAATGAVCSGRGTCLNGVCVSCSAGFCGSACQDTSPCPACAADMFGADCERNCTCLNGGTCTGSGRTGDGSCSCRVGYVGASCEHLCPGSIVGTHVCSGHGVCDNATNSSSGSSSGGNSSSGSAGYAVCSSCAPGYAGNDCSRFCDTSSVALGACSGHGVCNDGPNGTGRCVSCSSGYVAESTACANLCQCARLTNVSPRLGGVCNRDGSCSCELRFKGPACDVCVSGWSGVFCEVPCVNGITSAANDRTCTCAAGSGGPSCDVQCPQGLNNDTGTPVQVVCAGSAHGTCLDGTSGDGSCRCTGIWGGRACECNATRCQQLLGEHARCDPTAADTCICEQLWATPSTASTLSRASTTSFTSPSSSPSSSSGGSSSTTAAPAAPTPSLPAEKCTACNAALAWSAQCSEKCACEAGHGECDPNSGLCRCFADRDRGFWTGTLCRSCADGYSGVQCDQPARVSVSQLPSLTSDVASNRNSRSAKNEHVVAMWQVPRTSRRSELAFLPSGTPTSALLTLTTRALVQYLTGEEFVPSAGQRVRLEVAAMCYTPSDIAADPKGFSDDSLSHVEIGAVWTRSTRLWMLRRCVNRTTERMMMMMMMKEQQQNPLGDNSSGSMSLSAAAAAVSTTTTTGGASNSSRYVEPAPMTGKWEVVSIPTHQPFSFPFGGFVPGTVRSPSGVQGLPQKYENCSFVQKLATTFLIADNAPHTCLVCVNRSSWIEPAYSNRDGGVNSSSSGANKSSSHRNNLRNHRRRTTYSIYADSFHHESLLVCFQIAESNDGTVSIMPSESALLHLNTNLNNERNPIQVVDRVHFERRLDQLLVFGSSSDRRCVGIRVPIRRGSAPNTFFPLLSHGELAAAPSSPIPHSSSRSHEQRCSSITHVVRLRLPESQQGTTLPLPSGSIEDWTVVAYNTGSPHYQARLAICNFSSFAVSPGGGGAGRIILNFSSNASVPIPTRMCVHPQNEQSGAEHKTVIGAVTYDPVLRQVFASYGRWTGSMPPTGTFAAVQIKRFQLMLPGAVHTARAAAMVQTTAPSISTVILPFSGTAYNLLPTAAAAAALHAFLTKDIVRVDGVQAARNKCGFGHAAAAVSEHGRQIFLAEAAVETEKSKLLLVDRLALVFVDSVAPQRVDTRGGTVLTITGRGFTPPAARVVGRAAPVPKCRLGTIVRDAQILSATTATCITVARTSDGCSGDELVSLSLEGTTFAYSDVSMRRIDAPVLKQALPSSGRYTAPSPIVISGDGLIDLGYTKCMYTVLVKNGTSVSSQPGRQPEFYIVNGRKTPSASTSSSGAAVGAGVFVDVNEIECDAPPVLTVPWNGVLDVSLDGSVFSGAPLAVQFFGPPAGIVVRTQQVTIVSAPTTVIQPLLTAIVDAVGQTVSANVLLIPVFAELSIVNFAPDSDAGDAAKSKPLKLEGPTSQIVNLQAISVNSPATITFSSLFLQFPPSGILTLGVRLRPTEQSASLSFDYRTTARISVQPGTLARIAIVRQPSEQIDTIGKLSQEPLIAPVDQAGNKLSLNSFDGIIIGVAVIERPLPRVSALSKSLLDSFVPLPNRNQTVVCARGGCDLGTLDAINARFGFSYTYYLWEIARPAVFLETRVMLPSCNAGSFRRLGGYICEPCIAHAKCHANGDIVVDPGYWRPSEFALKVYDCFPPQACPGGNASAACAEGYVGPRCSICETGRGKSVTDRCDPCTTMSKVAFIISIVVVTTCIICFVIFVVQNWDDPDRHVTTLQLALTQMQLLVAMTDLEFDYPSWYRQTQSYVALFSDLRIFESANADCTLRPEGATFFTRFVTYVGTPLMALLVAGIAWILLYLNPMLFRYSQKMEEMMAKKEAMRKKAAERRAEAAAAGKSISELKTIEEMTESLKDRLERRWYRKQRVANRDEETEIRVALKDLLAGSEDEDDEALETAQMMKQIRPDSAPRIKSRNPPMARTSISFLTLTAQQVILFFMYPSTVQYSLSMQSCVEVEDTATGGGKISYLKVDPTIDCNTNTYLAFRFSALTFGIGMLLGVPFLIILVHYIHGRFRPHRRRERAQIFSFLMQGVRPRRWYYPALIFLRKGLSTAIVAYFGAPLDAYITMWALIFYLPAVYYLKPYLRSHHNFLEALAVSATIVAINLSLIIYAVPNNETLSTICSAIIVAMMSCILVLFAYISSAKTRYIVWGQFRSYFGHVTDSESDDAIDFDAEKKALAEPLLVRDHPDGAAGNNTLYSSRAVNAAKATGVKLADIEAAEKDGADAVGAGIGEGSAAFAEIRMAERYEHRKRQLQSEMKARQQRQGRRDDTKDVGGVGGGDPDSDLELVDACGPQSTVILQEKQREMMLKHQKPSAAATSSAVATDDDFASWTAQNRSGSSAVTAAVAAAATDDHVTFAASAFTKPRMAPTIFSAEKVAAEIAKAEQLAAERKARQSYHHIGDNDEVMRFKRRAPDIVNHAERAEKLRLDLEQKREQRKQARDAQKQATMESSPYVYVPKISASDSLVQGLSADQRLAILNAQHIELSDLVKKPETRDPSSSSFVPVPSSSSFSPSPSRATLAPVVYDQGQQLLERCFQPRFEVRTRNLDGVVASGLAERQRHEAELEKFKRTAVRIEMSQTQAQMQAAKAALALEDE